MKRTHSAPGDPGTVTGAHAVLKAAAAHGVDVCFANPGTTEMPIVRALDDVRAVRPVLGLFEGVCTGAADGFARIAGRPASTLLHLGPGFANGIANLHNARRARTPMLNLVGDQASWHLAYDAPLTSDIHSLARPVSGWVRTSARAADLARDTAEALAATTAFPRSPATLVVPLDFQQATVSGALPGRRPSPGRPAVDGQVVDECAKAIRAAHRCVLLLGDDALGERGQRAAAAVMEATGATAYSETFPSVAERGGGLPGLDRLPYFPEAARAALAGADLVLLAGALEPVSYFGYEGIPARLAPPESVTRLAEPGQDSQSALEDLAAALGATPPATRRCGAPVVPGGGALTPRSVGVTLTALLPEGAIVSVEGGTCGYPFFTASAVAARHTAMTNTGGAIGQGLPVAVGAAIAAPGRRVVALQSDGSAQYTIQALWTMAREQLPVTVLIASNSRYGVLRTELDRLGARTDGPASERLTSLADPAIGWPALAAAYGVGATSVSTVDELAPALARSLLADGPSLIELKL
ncbi:acetolactate synthase large subunit [Amycolatopsis sp. NPDC004625]|uniref:acetolactate synthase large subunit n=1 Tax=Amycolatopsis sp. NPDC004625 TaxID=3154670 RepID=UPI0033A2B24F